MYTGAGSWAYLMDGKLGYSAGGLRPALQQAEVDRLTEMGQWWRKTSGDLQAPGPTTQLGSSPAVGGSKSCLLGEARDFQFFDGVFKVSPCAWHRLTLRSCMPTPGLPCISNSTSRTGLSRQSLFVTFTMSLTRTSPPTLSTASASRVNRPLMSLLATKLVIPSPWEISGPNPSRAS